jgi:hypothetical protein
MTTTGRCARCGHWRDNHDEAGRCLVVVFSKGRRGRVKWPCTCKGFEESEP